MAITFLKQPLTYFNVFEPAIFEFSSDADLGVNVTELVADLQISSFVSSKRYLIKNIPPNYGTGVFRIDISGYLKALMLDDFNYDFDKPKKIHAIERYSIGVDVHSDNASDTLGDEYVFDSGYVFDTSFIFAQSAPQDTSTLLLYAMLGVTNTGGERASWGAAQLNILTPLYSEFCAGFENTIGIFTHATPVRYFVVGGEVTPILGEYGGVTAEVITVQVSDAQALKMSPQMPTLLEVSANSNGIPSAQSSELTYGLSYAPEECEDTIQLRFFQSFASYSYFYGAREADTGSRSGSKFVNNNFYNIQDGQTPQKLRTSTRKKSFTISGTKNILLYESFQELINSPSIFVLLDSGYTECEVTGSASKRENDFEYSLTINISNINTMDL